MFNRDRLYCWACDRVDHGDFGESVIMADRISDRDQIVRQDIRTFISRVAAIGKVTQRPNKVNVHFDDDHGGGFAVAVHFTKYYHQWENGHYFVLSELKPIMLNDDQAVERITQRIIQGKVHG